MRGRRGVVLDSTTYARYSIEVLEFVPSLVSVTRCDVCLPTHATVMGTGVWAREMCTASSFIVVITLTAMTALRRFVKRTVNKLYR